MVKVVARIGVLAITIALVLVPTIARARQQVDHRDATRLSIRHNWLGVAPPSKTSVAPEPVVALPTITRAPEPCRLGPRRPVVVEQEPYPVLTLFRDPLRGPPSLQLS